MTGAELATAPAPSTPPQELKIAIYLQAILFLIPFLTGIAAYTFFGETKGHPVAAAVIMLLLGGIWSFLLCGLWWRRNWVRWLTVIWNVVGLCLALRTIIANHHAPNIPSCFRILIAVTATVIFLRPVADHWYRRKAG